MPTINSKIKVLLIEDSPNAVASLALLLAGKSYYQIKTYSVDDLIIEKTSFKKEQFDIAIIDSDYSDIEPLSLITKLYLNFPRLPLIFMTTNQQKVAAFSSCQLEIAPDKIGIQEYITKEHISTPDLENLITCAITKSKIADELQTLKQSNLELKSQLKYTQELFKTVVDTTSTLIWMIDAQENYTFLNQAWLSFAGQTLPEGLTENWRDRIHPEDLAQCDRAYQSALKKCQGFQIEYRIRRFDCTYRTILNTAVRRYNSRGEFAGLLCSCLDITQRKKIEQKLLHKAETDRILAEITQNIHSYLDLDIILETSIEQINQYLQVDKIFIAKLFENHQIKLLFESGKSNTSLSCNLDYNQQLPRQEIIDNYEQLSQGKIITQDNLSLTGLLDTNSTELGILELSLLLVPIISHQKLWGLLCIKQDKTPRQWQADEIMLMDRVAIQLGIAIKQSELLQKLEELSVVDGLTKIANRRKFDRYLAAEWKRLTREQNPLSLILCDVDHFKLYNDTYGHQAGDLCLRQIAQAISHVVKRPADLVARYGGEEFAVILPNTDLNGAKYIAQKIRLQIASLRIPHINSPVDLYVTLSFGVASCIPRVGLGYYGLISAADSGLYQGKELGRNRIVKFEIDNL